MASNLFTGLAGRMRTSFRKHGSTERPSGYRRDIDGLRAVAVLSVLAYHLDNALLPGGFVGVDVFFVISGYLITSIIQREILAGEFSFRKFYIRRIRRIAPAYVAVTLATLVAAAVLMVPEDLHDVARSALWSAVSLPNVYFWKFLDISYFAPASDQIPLLHLWSLGVEEQFYLLWPALLLLLLFRKDKRIAAIAAVVIAVASFHLAQITASTAPKFAYYMLPARAGELMVGAVLSLVASGTNGAREKGSIGRALWSEFLAVVGLGLIVYSMFWLDGEDLFPGINAIFPCLGAAFVILAGVHRQPLASAPLRFSPVVWIGLISYSLYLWHWPVLAFTRYFLVTIEPRAAFWCLALIVVLSVLSYRYVELPLRRHAPSTGAESKRDHAPAVFVGVTLALSGLCLLLQDPRVSVMLIPNRVEYLTKSRELAERTKPALAYRYNCQRSRLDPKLFEDERCVIRPGAAKAGPVRAILVGDSNAAHYVGMLGSIGDAMGFAFRNVTVSSCPPLFGGGDHYGKPSDRPGCTRYRNAIRAEVKEYDYVFLGAQWSSHSRTPGFEADLAATVRELSAQGKTVVVLGQAPRFQSYDAHCEQRQLRMPLVDCRSRAEATGRVDDSVNRLLRSTIDDVPRVYYVDAKSVICPKGKCSPYLNGRPIYFDPGHISMVGSWEIGQHMVEHFLPSRRMFTRLGMKRPAEAGASP